MKIYDLRCEACGKIAEVMLDGEKAPSEEARRETCPYCDKRGRMRIVLGVAKHGAHSSWRVS